MHLLGSDPKRSGRELGSRTDDYELLVGKRLIFRIQRHREREARNGDAVEYSERILLKFSGRRYDNALH